MELNYIDTLLFTIHLVLLIVKLWLGLNVSGMIIFSDTPKIDNKMLVFNKYKGLLFLFILVTILNEIYFIFTYFVLSELYIYEFISVMDQILLSSIILFYLIKGGKKYG